MIIPLLPSRVKEPVPSRVKELVPSRVKELVPSLAEMASVVFRGPVYYGNKMMISS